jgi:hypothetical protein
VTRSHVMVAFLLLAIVVVLLAVTCHPHDVIHHVPAWYDRARHIGLHGH